MPDILRGFSRTLDSVLDKLGGGVSHPGFRYYSISLADLGRSKFKPKLTRGVSKMVHFILYVLTDGLSVIFGVSPLGML